VAAIAALLKRRNVHWREVTHTGVMMMHYLGDDEVDRTSDGRRVIYILAISLVLAAIVMLVVSLVA
jgi:hypothetical protein